MKVLLVAINAKYIHSNLAVHSLRASAGVFQEKVEVAEYTINQRKDEILEDVYRRNPTVLCFSVYVWNLEYVEAIATEFHKLMPEVPIWVGGPEVSHEVEVFLKEHAYVRGVMIGEGEDTFRELCAYYAGRRDAERSKLAGRTGNDAEKDQSKRNISEIPGIAWRGEEGDILFTARREVKNLSEIPFCYGDLEEYRNRIIYYESSRGCPYSCSYCLSSLDKRLRFRDMELVKKELQFFLDKKVAQVKFVDRTFNCDHRHAMAIWRYLKEHDNGVTNFHFEVSADLFQEEELILIKSMRSGLIQLEIGVQSTNEATIREIHRTMRLERVKEVVREIREAGNVHQHLDLIAGLPHEGYESFRKSFDEIHALWPNQLQLGFLKVLKGSFLYEHAEEYGIAYHDGPPYEVLYTKWLTYADVLKIKRVEETLETYYNSGQFEVTMKVLSGVCASAFDFYLALGKYYESRGYLGMQFTRIRRCEILLAFLASKEFQDVKKEDDGGGEKTASDFQDVIRESLTFDLYYRENCKTRPSWAPDAGTYKEKTRVYCGKGKLSHLEPFHYHFPGKSQVGLEELPQRLEQPVWALFHYDQRDPLDHQARVEYVP